jgi:hypothetical protein
MSGWAEPGKKCVCVRLPSVGTDFRGVTRIPHIGEVLTIREVFIGRTIAGDEVVALKFHEIKNPLVLTIEGMVERGYACAQYRPLVDQSDDVALFAHHLIGRRVEVDA